MPVAILSPGTTFLPPADAGAADVVLPANVVYSLDGVLQRVAPQFGESDGTALHSSLEAFLTTVCLFEATLSSFGFLAYTLAPSTIVRLVAAAESCPEVAALSDGVGPAVLADTVAPLFRSSAHPEFVIKETDMLRTAVPTNGAGCALRNALIFGDILTPYEDSDECLADNGAALLIASLSSGRGAGTALGANDAALLPGTLTSLVGACQGAPVEGVPVSAGTFVRALRALADLPLHPLFLGLPIKAHGVLVEIRRRLKLTDGCPNVRNKAYASLLPATAARLRLTHIGALVAGMGAADRAELATSLFLGKLLHSWSVLSLRELDVALAPFSEVLAGVDPIRRGTVIRERRETEAKLLKEASEFAASARLDGRADGATVGGGGGGGLGSSLLDSACLAQIHQTFESNHARAVVAALGAETLERPFNIVYAVAVVGSARGAYASTLQRLPQTAPDLVRQLMTRAGSFETALSFFLVRCTLFTFKLLPAANDPPTAGAGGADGAGEGGVGVLLPPGCTHSLDALPAGALPPAVVSALRSRKLSQLTSPQLATLVECAFGAMFSRDPEPAGSLAGMRCGLAKARRVLPALFRLLCFDSMPESDAGGARGLDALLQDLDEYLLHAGHTPGTIETADGAILLCLEEMEHRFREDALSATSATGLTSVYSPGDASYDRVQGLLEGIEAAAQSRRTERRLGNLKPLTAAPPPPRRGAGAPGSGSGNGALAAGGGGGLLAGGGGVGGGGAGPLVAGVFRSAAAASNGANALVFKSDATSYTYGNVVFNRVALEKHVARLGFPAASYLVAFLLVGVDNPTAALGRTAVPSNNKLPLVLPTATWFKSKECKQFVDVAASLKLRNPLPPYFR